jgi:hypothetical protein
MVQLLDRDGRRFSFLAPAADAGLHHDQDGGSSPVTDPPDLLADQRPAGQDHRAVLEAAGEPLAIGDHDRWGGAVIDGPAGLLSWHPQRGELSVPDPDSRP